MSVTDSVLEDGERLLRQLAENERRRRERRKRFVCVELASWVGRDGIKRVETSIIPRSMQKVATR